jgi:uncharacterized protein (DUF1778 family)
MGRRKNHTELYHFLERTGALATGDKKKIQEAKEIFWKDYRKTYSRNKRKEKRSLNISFTQKEFKLIAKAAESHTNTTSYIRQAALGLAQGVNIYLSRREYNTFIELLTLTYTKLQFMENEEKLTHAQSKDLFDSLNRQEEWLKQKLNVF